MRRRTSSWSAAARTPRSSPSRSARRSSSRSPTSDSPPRTTSLVSSARSRRRCRQEVDVPQVRSEEVRQARCQARLSSAGSAVLPRRRLDAELVRRHLAPDLHEARAEIAAGRVTVGGAPAASAARLVGPAEPVVLEPVTARFVGRGGEKLDAALEQFDLEVSGARALDVGASTGGFTDCLLQRGAASVVAVDVGYGQLDSRLRGRPAGRRQGAHERAVDAPGRC